MGMMATLGLSVRLLPGCLSETRCRKEDRIPPPPCLPGKVQVWAVRCGRPSPSPSFAHGAFYLVEKPQTSPFRISQTIALFFPSFSSWLFCE